MKRVIDAIHKTANLIVVKMYVCEYENWFMQLNKEQTEKYWDHCEYKG